MRAVRSTVWATALLALAGPPVRAQRQDSLSEVGAALARLQLESHVRLHTLTGRVFEGALLWSSAGNVGLDTPDAPGVETVALLGDVDSLWVRRSHAGSGALIGAALLALPGALLGNGVYQLSQDCTGCSSAGAVIEGALVGAGIGAVFGALIGSASRYWSLAVP